MAEKKELKKLIESLKNFIKRELKIAEFLLEKNRARVLTLPEKVEQTAVLFSKKEKLNEQGVLSVIYLEYLEYLSETTEKERNTIKGIIDKFGRYADALVEVPFNDGYRFSFEANIGREALRINATRNKRGERRYSDCYNARMLIQDYGEDIRYCVPWKKWIIWDGRRWNKKNDYGIYFLAKKAVYEMNEKALKKNSKDDKIVLMEHAGRSESTLKIQAMVKNALWEESLWIDPDDLDNNKMIFNCSNGSIDLSSGRLLKHERKNLITKISPVEYDVNAECELWKEFLKSIFKKNKALIQFVQKIMGICLTGSISEQAMFILYGTGANGKSTFIDTMMKIMGDYGSTTPTETLMQKKGDSSSNDIARLQGTRFVSAMESDIGGKLAEAVVKRLTGNDKIIARFLYGEYFEYKPTFKIFMATNHKPKVTGMDEAIWRRLKLIPFEVTFKKNQQDPELPEKLKKELPGILAWMVEGCILWQKKGLRNPPAIVEANTKYRHEMSAIETFLQECCRKDENAMIQASHLYEAYKGWAEKNNEYIISMRLLGMRLAESGMDKTRLSAGNHWIGIELNK